MSSASPNSLQWNSALIVQHFTLTKTVQTLFSSRHEKNASCPGLIRRWLFDLQLFNNSLRTLCAPNLLCINYEGLGALVYRNSIPCLQETKSSLCQHRPIKDALGGRVNGGGGAEGLECANQKVPGPAVIIYIWPHSGSKSSYTPGLHLSSPLKQFPMPHPTQGSAETALPTHTVDPSSDQFPSWASLPVYRGLQVTAPHTSRLF